MAFLYASALECAVEAATRAGRHLLEESRRPGGPRGWGSHADADIEAEALIHAKLQKQFPDWGYLGEELGVMAAPGEHLWLVDPNDATSAFLQGLRGPSVSIALLRDSQPVLGVVFAYTAPDEAGDLIAWAEGCGPIRRNDVAVNRSWPSEPTASCVALVSVKRTAADLQRSAAIADPISLRQYPSIAYRLALVAAGEADLAVSTTGLKSWDIAAGHAMVRAAGGVLHGGGSAPIEYAQDGSIDSGGRVLGGSPALVAHVEQRLRQPPTTDRGGRK